MTTLYGSIRLRPTRIGFLVSPMNMSEVRRIMQICTCLWGGAFNPIIPVCEEMPELWSEHPLPSPAGPAGWLTMGGNPHEDDRESRIQPTETFLSRAWFASPAILSELATTASPRMHCLRERCTAAREPEYEYIKGTELLVANEVHHSFRH